MGRTLRIITVSLLLCLVATGSGCLLEDKVIQIIVTDRTCAEFHEEHTSQSMVEPYTLDYAERIDEILADNGLSRSDLASAKLVSVSYKVTSITAGGDKVISGMIRVERIDVPGSPQVLVNYSSQSVSGALGVEIPAALNAAGVGVINQALQDFIAEQPGTKDPVLVFSTEQESIVPPASDDEPLIFDWIACIEIYVVANKDIEVPKIF